MQPDDPLAGLRALHLPPPPASFWSDVGFAVAFGLLIALLASLLVRWLFKPRLSLRASAMGALVEASRLRPEDRRAAQAALLRRIVRTVEGEEAARAQGADWTTALDRVFATDLFSRRNGRVFADGLYARPSAPVDDPELDRELGALVAKLKR
ncbi:DUF4381 domain-containing protein [Chelatococcus sambhunathii]|uniref:DUF4381 domain-containing protein n=1 Tax=Chelatococcus sambhunathii TaxID=363953 RepID=A0ABU1DLG2_9HYPH|nr:DUF4381 domain-containing protein [Chelatococcus sambhunathii]MDR4308848.1 DUF4381 domain-containing protein [Chelatococcus sambhunathii]